MNQVLSKIQSWVLVALIFLLPLFFLPTTPDFFDFNKMTLLAVGGVVLSVLWAIGLVASGRFSWTRTSLDIPVLLFAIVTIISAISRTPNRMDAFVIPGTATIILAATLLYFVTTQTIRSEGSRRTVSLILFSLLSSGVVVSLVALLATTGLLNSIGALPGFIKAQTFSPVGAPLPALTFLLVLVPLIVGRISASTKDKLMVSLYFGLLAVVLLAVVALGSQVVVNKATQVRLLPLSTGWAVAVETLKQSPFGVGPGNFLTAFNQYRPIEYNATDVWNLRFGASSNYYLQTFAELGIVGLVALLFIVLGIVRKSGNWRLTSENWAQNALFVALLIFLVVPANLVLLSLFYIILAIFAASHGREVSYSARFAAPLTFILIAGGAIAFAIFGGRAYAAEMAYKRALDAGVKNDAQGLVNNLNAAISLNPSVDRYHISASQALFDIANAYARQKGKDATDDDRKKITGFVQDAIRQAQIAVAFNNRRANNWENLASIYRALIPMAKDADQFAVAAFTQAIALDPINPLLRISLGGVHYGAGRYEDAIRTFELAAQSKPDFANAHYNLAAALREKGDFARAAQEMEQVLALVQPGTKDYEAAQKELDSLKSKIPAPATGSGETLQAPQASSSPVVEPPLTLPQDAVPPSPSASPAPSPAAN